MYDRELLVEDLKNSEHVPEIKKVVARILSDYEKG